MSIHQPLTQQIQVALSKRYIKEQAQLHDIFQRQKNSQLDQKEDRILETLEQGADKVVARPLEADNNIITQDKVKSDNKSTILVPKLQKLSTLTPENS